METNIGILHPGAMGISVAKSALDSECNVFWLSQGRSEKTRERAEQYQLIETKKLTDLCKQCPILFSICPPHAAEEVAEEVLSQSFKGIYVDANAIFSTKGSKNW